MEMTFCYFIFFLESPWNRRS